MNRRSDPLFRPRSHYAGPVLLSGLLLALAAVWSPAAAADSTRSAPAGTDWRSFRGDAQLSGRATGTLPQSLRVAWTFADEFGYEATAAIVDGRVFIGSMAGRFVALDLATGEEIWQFETQAEIKSSPLIDGDTVYFGDEAGQLHSLSLATGRLRWSFATEGGITSSPNRAGPCLLFGSYDNHLYCVHPETGDELWKIETEGYVNATPAVWEGHAVSAGCDGLLRIVRLTDGVEVRQVELGGYVGASAAVHGDASYVGNFENQVLGIDMRQGVVVWQYDPPERDFPFYSSAAVTEDLVVIGGRDKLVHALDPASGKPRWTYTAGGRIDSSPVVIDGRAFVATQSGELLALNLETGSPVWKFETGEAMVASPAVAAGYLVIGSAEGTLFAFGAAGREDQ